MTYIFKKVSEPVSEFYSEASVMVKDKIKIQKLEGCL